MSKYISTISKDFKLDIPPKIAIIVSNFNKNITNGLKEGAIKWLEDHDINDIDIYEAPGAFEMPLMVKRLTKMGWYEGIICLGCIIKGDTAHFEFISLGTTMGIIQNMLNAETPVSFGILTTYTEEQAIERSRDNEHNKGIEAAIACIQTISFLRSTYE